MNRASTFVHSFLVVGILAAGVSSVAATQITYSSLPLQDDHVDDITAAAPVVSQFLGALSSYGTETYDEITPMTNGTLSFGATGITASNTFTVVEGPFNDNTYSYSGNSLLEFPGESGNTFYLSSPVTAFGTYIDQAGDTDADTLSLLLQNTNTMTSETVPIGTIGPNADPYNIFYFGVTDTNPFNVVTLVLSSGDDGVLLDNTSVGFAAVPEPSSLALVCGSLLIGLAAFFVRRASARRRTAILPGCGSC
jgi:hypothetical protein